VYDGSQDSSPSTFSISVTPVDDAPIANNISVTTPEDTPVGITLTSTNPDNEPLTFTVLTQPTNGTLSGSAPNLTYTPNPNYFGSDSFTFQVSDGTNTSSATVSITVTPVGGDAPVANNQSLTTPEDTPLAITLTGSDPDGNAITFSIVSGPSNGTLSGSGANVTYTPNANYNGPDSFTFKVNDGSMDSSPATISITVTPVNDAPIANNQSLTYDLDTPKPITLTGSDVEGSPLTFTILTNPSNGTLSGSAPNVIYTPNSGFTGTDTFTFKVNDGELDSSPATITLNLTPLTNFAPVAQDISVTTPEDTPVGITLVATDSNGDALTYIITQAPANGTLSVVSGASVTYTPNANYNGPDSFKYKANDGTVDSNEGTVNITVTPVNDVPIANAQSVTTPEDTSIDITLTGSDVEGSSLTYAIVTQPTHGVVTLVGNVATYTPALNYNGLDSFTFTVNDGTATSIAATVSITVTPVNDAPVVTNTVINVTTTEDTPVDITLTVTDADGDTFTYIITQAPTNGTISAVSGAGVITYSPYAYYT
jgi:hypothetical protein